MTSNDQDLSAQPAPRPIPPSFAAHLRAALIAAALLGPCQLVVGTLIIAMRTRGFLLSPHGFFGTQLYDFPVKLVAIFPATRDWLYEGALDRFLPEGFVSKLPIAFEAVLPNVVVLIALALILACVARVRNRPARISFFLWGMVACGFFAHVLSLLFAVHVPVSWTVAVLVRNAGRVMIWDGAWLSFVAFALASAAAALLALLSPAARAKCGVGTLLMLALVLFATPDWLQNTPDSASSLAGAAISEQQTHVDNVILISIDSLRANRLGCYGNTRNTSPLMDKLAREGTLFSSAMSTTSWTLPSHVSMLTGRYLLSHGVITRNDQIPEAVTTLAEVLNGEGLSTGAVVSAPLLHSRYGFSRGFNDYDQSTIPSRSSIELLRAEPAPVGTDLAIDWLRQRGQERFFLFLHYWDVHYDYAPPPPYDRMFDPNYAGSVTGDDFYHNKSINRHMAKRDLDHILALYDGEIRWVDDNLARLISALEELQLGSRTAIIVTADHGDEFFEHGYKGHTRTLYREVIHVPLIIRGPGLEAGQVVQTPVSLTDVMPTIIDLLGVRPPGGMDGTSLLSVLRGGRLPDRPGVHAWLCNQNSGVHCQSMQYSAEGTLIHHFQPLRLEFYSPDDRWQQHNVASSPTWPKQRQLQAMSQLLSARWAAHRTLSAEKGTVEVDEAELERLRALGYAE